MKTRQIGFASILGGREKVLAMTALAFGDTYHHDFRGGMTRLDRFALSSDRAALQTKYQG